MRAPFCLCHLLPSSFPLPPAVLRAASEINYHKGSALARTTTTAAAAATHRRAARNNESLCGIRSRRCYPQQINDIQKDMYIQKSCEEIRNKKVSLVNSCNIDVRKRRIPFVNCYQGFLSCVVKFLCFQIQEIR